MKLGEGHDLPARMLADGLARLDPEGEAPVEDGLAAMASGDNTPDGCTCGHTGECRVCKLKAALEAARGGGSAQPPSAGAF